MPVKQLATRAGLFLVWCLAMAWLVRYEAFPEAFTHSVPGYKGLLSSDLLMSDEWMKVLLKGKPVGYVHTSLDTDDQNALHHYQIRNQMSLAINIMGERRDIQMDSLVKLDLNRNLQQFALELKTGLFDDMSIHGLRGLDSRFLLAFGSGTNATHTTIVIPDDVILYSPMSTILAKNMKPGEHLSMKTMDPFTRNQAVVTLEAIRRESIQIGSNQCPALLLRTYHQGLELNSWISNNGEILRQSLPGGIVIEKSTPEAATEAYLKADVTTDILPDILQVLGRKP